MSIILYIEISYNISQFCILVKPEISDFTGGKAVLTQIQNDIYILKEIICIIYILKEIKISKKIGLQKLRFKGERYYIWLNQMKSL